MKLHSVANLCVDVEYLYKDLLKRVHEQLKPLGYKKDGANFRLFQEDGLCKIINFQRSKWNTKESIEFTINLGIYFEKETIIQNKKFKEYDCQIRRRIFEQDKWWFIGINCDYNKIREDVINSLESAHEYFDLFESKGITIKYILSNKAQQYSETNVMNYATSKLLVEMGHEKEVYELIKDTNPKHKYVFKFAEELKWRVTDEKFCKKYND